MAKVKKKFLFWIYVAGDVYPKLNALEPVFLKNDVAQFTKANGMRIKNLELFPDMELLSLEMAQVHVLPHSLKRTERKRQHPLKTTDKEAQLVSNFETHVTPPESHKIN